MALCADRGINYLQATLAQQPGTKTTGSREQRPKEQSMSTQRTFACAVVALCFGLNAGSQVDAQSYPTQPSKNIVPAAPGGPSDLPARLAGKSCRRSSGSRGVENRGGAGGAIRARGRARRRTATRS
jgi:hypothetical protein